MENLLCADSELGIVEITMSSKSIASNSDYHLSVIAGRGTRKSYDLDVGFLPSGQRPTVTQSRMPRRGWGRGILC